MFTKYFLMPVVITFISIFLVYYYAGFVAFASVLILIALEVTLSFDNAVVNAKVLEKMDEKWRKRFINWGIWVAVFGTRVILPILIVAAVSGLGVTNVLNLAFFYPNQYGLELDKAHYSIGSFGGIFLLLVALKYFIDDGKNIHWIRRIEKRLQKFSSIESIEIVFVLTILMGIAYSVPQHSEEILISGIIGIILFTVMQGITNKLEDSFDNKEKKIASAGLGLFVYLNILDSAFSLDGVIGAFAISTNLLVIGVGLGIGAYFVRSLTLLMVEKKTLKELVYLEHGAHWAVFGLGLCMLLGLVVHIPEIITGIIGLVFVVASYFSSVKKVVKV